MNPYDVLGIGKKATAAQVKSAYRRVAKLCHPDAGAEADGEKFHAAAKAYAVLRDPERRKQYDTTGRIDDAAAVNLQQRMLELIAQMFGALLEQTQKSGQSLKSIDLMKNMTLNLEGHVAQAKAEAAKAERQIADRTMLLTRITREGDGQNLFVDILNYQINALLTAKKQHEINMRALEMAYDEVKAYESEVELIQAVQTIRWGGGAFGQAQTGTFVWSTSTT